MRLFCVAKRRSIRLSWASRRLSTASRRLSTASRITAVCSVRSCSISLEWSFLDMGTGERKRNTYLQYRRRGKAVKGGLGMSRERHDPLTAVCDKRSVRLENPAFDLY